MSEKKRSTSTVPGAEAVKSAAPAPTAAALQNPYRRIFTETPDFVTLARCAYDARKAAAVSEPAEAADREKNAPADG